MGDALITYQKIPLSAAGMALGLVMVLLYGWMLFKGDAARQWAKKLPRNYNAGVWSMAIGMLWFWLLVAPAVGGPLSFLGKLSMDLGEFRWMKPFLQIGVPLACVGMILYVREFLFVRGLGLCLLMAAGPLLYAAFLKEPASRVLVSGIAYIMIIKGLFFVGMPYLFRDGMNWITATSGRWRISAMLGLILGLVVWVCALTVWRGH